MTLAKLMTAEHGKPFFQSKPEIAYAGSFIEWFAETANRNYGDTIPSERSLPPTSGSSTGPRSDGVGKTALAASWSICASAASEAFST
jgi:acyl-CoA reductase-like NAD-dependent aldehyde dehydrogenase